MCSISIRRCSAIFGLPCPNSFSYPPPHAPRTPFGSSIAVMTKLSPGSRRKAATADRPESNLDQDLRSPRPRRGSRLLLAISIALLLGWIVLLVYTAWTASR